MDPKQKTRRYKLQCLLIAACAWPSAVPAFDGDNPFRVIPERNAFSLGREPRSAKPVATPEIEKPSDIKLTGIFKHKGIERAALAVLEPSDKSAKPSFMQ